MQATFKRAQSFRRGSQRRYWGWSDAKVTAFDTGTGILQIPVELYQRRLNLGASCAGAVLTFAADEHECELVLPVFEPLNDSDSVHKTVFQNPHVRSEVLKEPSWGLHSFGFVSRGRNRNSSFELVEFVAERFLVIVRTNDVPNNVKTLFQSIERTIFGMADWLEVLAFEDFSFGDTGHYKGPSLVPCFVDATGNISRIEGADEVITHNILIRDEVPPAVDMIAQALRLGSVRKEIDPIHALLISALKHQNVGNNRGAVLDAATAVEMGLTRKMQDLLEPMGKPFSDIYFHRKLPVKTLSVDIGRLSGEVPLEPGTIDQNISTPRNKAIHRGEEVSDREAFAAVAFARTFVYDQFPPPR